MHFTKMQGAGNDFIVINNMALKLPLEKLPDMARKLCERRVSIGANALMVADFPEKGGDFQMRFYNADGTIAEMCGNGARCIARYAYENGFARESMTIETVAGPVLAWRQEKRKYKIKLNDPGVLKLDCPVEAEGKSWECSYVELGNPGIPHAVVRYPGLADKTEDELKELGKTLRYHSAFPKGANVNFYDVASGNDVVEKTYERGVEDFTLACGTGSGSTAAVLTLLGKVPGPTVHLSVPGGDLWVEVERTGDAVTGLYLIGDTNIVAEGEIMDEDLVL
ncbi:MAG: diaminopimelate epimerase [Clostridia bacterium]|nr:diaminopimelate epimerase [Clostridia bacterium]